MTSPPPIKRPLEPDGQPLFSQPLKETLEGLATYYNFTAVDESFAGQQAERVEMKQALFREVKLTESKLSGIRLSDGYLIKCDLSVAHWHKAQLERVELVECHLMGFQLMRADLNEVRVQKCDGSLAQFRFAKLHNVRFENCNLRNADFYGADLKHVVFENCDLRDADLSAATLKDVDLRSSQIQAISLSPTAVPGLIIEARQAVDVVRLLGGRVV